MKDFAQITPPAPRVEVMSAQDLRAYKDMLLQQIGEGSAEEDALWGKVARVNAYIRAASKA